MSRVRWLPTLWMWCRCRNCCMEIGERAMEMEIWRAQHLATACAVTIYTKSTTLENELEAEIAQIEWMGSMARLTLGIRPMAECSKFLFTIIYDSESQLLAFSFSESENAWSKRQMQSKRGTLSIYSFKYGLNPSTINVRPESNKPNWMERMKIKSTVTDKLQRGIRNELLISSFRSFSVDRASHAASDTKRPKRKEIII